MERNPYAPPQAEVRDPEPPAGPDELASRWARLGGSLIDGTVLLILLIPLTFLTDYWEEARTGTVSQVTLFGVSIAGFVVFCILNGYLLGAAGQTVGKRLVGTRIVRVDGRVATLGRLLGIRYGLMYVFNAIPVFGNVFSLVDPLFIFRQDRRCLHDLIAGTKVVRAGATDRRG